MPFALLGPGKMGDAWQTGLIGIGGTIGITWLLNRRGKEVDDLRTIYADWASKAHDLLARIDAVYDDAENASIRHGAPDDYFLPSPFENPEAWRATGIDQAKAALEKARFKVVMSDANERRVRSVVDQTERLAKLGVGSYDTLRVAKRELEAIVIGVLRPAFRLRTLLDDQI